jgi:hypothetical protein
MKMAIRLSETAYQGGYMPFGAVLADAKGQIIVEAHNMSARAKKRGGSGDITRHAGEDCLFIGPDKVTLTFLKQFRQYSVLICFVYLSSFFVDRDGIGPKALRCSTCRRSSPMYLVHVDRTVCHVCGCHLLESSGQDRFWMLGA